MTLAAESHMLPFPHFWQRYLHSMLPCPKARFFAIHLPMACHNTVTKVKVAVGGLSLSPLSCHLSSSPFLAPATEFHSAELTLAWVLSMLEPALHLSVANSNKAICTLQRHQTKQPSDEQFASHHLYSAPLCSPSLALLTENSCRQTGSWARLLGLSYSPRFLQQLRHLLRIVLPAAITVFMTLPI